MIINTLQYSGRVYKSIFRQYLQHKSVWQLATLKYFWETKTSFLVDCPPNYIPLYGSIVKDLFIIITTIILQPYSMHAYDSHLLADGCYPSCTISSILSSQAFISLIPPHSLLLCLPQSTSSAPPLHTLHIQACAYIHLFSSSFYMADSFLYTCTHLLTFSFIKA